MLTLTGPALALTWVPAPELSSEEDDADGVDDAGATAEDDGDGLAGTVTATLVTGATVAETETALGVADGACDAAAGWVEPVDASDPPVVPVDVPADT